MLDLFYLYSEEKYFLEKEKGHSIVRRKDSPIPKEPKEWIYTKRQFILNYC
jgi:hypothetical protein